MLVPTYGLCGDVEPLVELVDQSLGFGWEVWAGTSPNLAEPLPGGGLPQAPTGASR